MVTYDTDALTLGARLKAEEREASKHRIARALHGGTPGNDAGPSAEGRSYIAMKLYEARYDGRAYWETPTHEEILEDFCSNVFGCSLTEALKAWDEELG